MSVEHKDEEDDDDARDRGKEHNTVRKKTTTHHHEDLRQLAPADMTHPQAHSHTHTSIVYIRAGRHTTKELSSAATHQHGDKACKNKLR